MSKRDRRRDAAKPPVRKFHWPTPSRRQWSLLGVFLVAICCAGAIFADWWFCLPDTETAHFVGRGRCIECHQAEGEKWTGSHHDLAMDLANENTVLGDFDDATIEHYGITSRMFRDGDRYMVHTEGPDGKMAEFEVKYVFGVDPLQQYMVELDRHPDAEAQELGRLQVLRVSWDTQAQQWFYLRPPDVDEKLAPEDDLHWTGVAQRWNNMCADCHSTNLKKNFDVQAARYRTTFSEIDVSCEACHGPGSLHIKLASQKSLFWDRKRGYGLAKLKSKDSEPQIQTCAQCHARRRLVHPEYDPSEDYYDYFVTELLEDLTYYPDGQIKDEVYVHGSFLQSKMYHKGVRCSDCHDPHSLKLKHNGNQVCTSCHQHPASKYDSPSHHFHKPDSAGASCVECHMPETTYMMVDPRRDHSLRVPRPDLSVDLNTPNACIKCHLDDDRPQGEKFAKLTRYQDWMEASVRDDELRAWLKKKNVWAAEATRKWYGEKQQPEHFAYAFALARENNVAAVEKLAAVYRNRTLPAIVRATAIRELGRFSGIDAQVDDFSQRALSDPHPLVRAAGVANLQGLPPRDLIRSLKPILQDESRAVRAEAARVLAMAPRAELDGRERQLHNAAIDEFVRGVLLNNDRAGAHMNLAILYDNLGKDEDAKDSYRRAIRTEPAFTGPRTNLAGMLDAELEALRRQMQQLTIQRRKDEALKLVEKAASLQAELEQLRVEELALLQRDARLAPENGPIHYRLGLLSYLLGLNEEAEDALKKAVALEPQNADFVMAQLLFLQKLERYREALPLAERLVELRPDDRQAEQLLKAIRAQASNPAAP